jgi:hypothetical protein
MHLAKAADIIRKQILQSKVKFTGNFEKESVLSGVPQCLFQLVSMIEHGPDIESQLENGVAKSHLAISQLLQYNCHKKASKGTSHPQKHSVERSLCIYNPPSVRKPEAPINRFIVSTWNVHFI